MTELSGPDIVTNTAIIARLHYRKVSDNLTSAFTTVETDVTSVQLEGKPRQQAGEKELISLIFSPLRAEPQHSVLAVQHGGAGQQRDEGGEHP